MEWDEGWPNEHTEFPSTAIRRVSSQYQGTTHFKPRPKFGGEITTNADAVVYEANTETIVVVDVRASLRLEGIHDFINRLGQFKTWLPRYANNRVLGAMVWLTADAGAEDMLEKRGLFSIRATGDSASIKNTADFTPRGG